MREVMGGAYIEDKQTGYLTAWWRNYRGLRWVEECPLEGAGSRDGDGVFFFEPVGAARVLGTGKAS
jgi:hypothetical protein